MARLRNSEIVIHAFRTTDHGCHEEINRKRVHPCPVCDGAMTSAEWWKYIMRIDRIKEFLES